MEITPTVYLVKLNNISQNKIRKFIPNTVKVYDNEQKNWKLYTICTDFGHIKKLSTNIGIPDYTDILDKNVL